MKARPQSLHGLRILVVEDEALVLMELEDMLQDFGCEIVGPVSTVAAALTAIGENELDGALLDMNLRGEHILPVAEKLLARRVPFLLVTGYAVCSGNAPTLDDAPRLTKPFSLKSRRAAMTELFAPHQQSALGPA
jgi:CheY-like chemotaxis protein